MLGPNLLSLESIPTLLRQGGIGESQTLIGGEYSVYLDGASDRIQGANLTDTWLKVMGPNASFSLSFDIRVLELPMTISFSGSAMNYFWIQLLADASLVVSRYDSSAGGTVYQHTWTTLITTGQSWQNITLTSDGSGTNRTWKCYIRGQDRGSESTIVVGPSSADSRPSGVKFSIGTFLGIVDYDFYIDRLMSWSEELSEDESYAISTGTGNYIDVRVDQGDYTSSNRLETFYAMEEGTGTTISDISGNGNADLTILNGTANVWSTSTLLNP